MGERKVLNKYYPPDFDPSKLPRVRRPKNQQIKVRMMLPMSIRCSTCGNYIYKGTKFNSRKEDVIGETYLGIQIFRFYFKCTKCSAELAIKTDPQNSDYVVESGATRNYEPWRSGDEEVEKEKQKRESEEMGDAMKSLENRTLDSKREMDIMAALDEMKSMKSRHAAVGLDEMLEALQRTTVEREKKLEEEDEALIKSVVFHNSKEYVRRLEDEDLDGDDDDDDDDDLVHLPSSNGESSSSNAKRQKISQEPSSNPTDSLTTTSFSDSSISRGKPKDSGAPNKFVFQNSTVMVSAIKKAGVASDVKKSGKLDSNKIQNGHSDKNLPKADEKNAEGEDKTASGSSALLSLCQNYDDSDNEE